VSIARAWYVTCDFCGNAIGGQHAMSVSSAADARQLAKSSGGSRRRVNGQMADLCEGCTDHFKKSASS
jgi:hypothetical protein